MIDAETSDGGQITVRCFSHFGDPPRPVRKEIGESQIHILVKDATVSPRLRNVNLLHFQNDAGVGDRGLGEDKEEEKRDAADHQKEQKCEKDPDRVSHTVIVEEKTRDKRELSGNQGDTLVEIHRSQLLLVRTEERVKVQSTCQDADGEDALDTTVQCELRSGNDGEERLPEQHDGLPKGTSIIVGLIEEPGRLAEPSSRPRSSGLCVRRDDGQGHGESQNDHEQDRHAECAREHGMGSSIAHYGCIGGPVAHRLLGAGGGDVVGTETEERAGNGLGDQHVGKVDDDEVAEKESLVEVQPRFGKSVSGDGPEDEEESGDRYRNGHDHHDLQHGARNTTRSRQETVDRQ